MAQMQESGLLDKFLAWRREQEAPNAAKEDREPRRIVDGYSITSWELADFVSSEVIITAPEGDPMERNSNRHQGNITFITESDSRLLMNLDFTGPFYSFVVESVADNLKMNIDGKAIPGVAVGHPERTESARTRGLGENSLVSWADVGSDPDPDRTKKFGESIARSMA